MVFSCNVLSNAIHFNLTSKRRDILCTGPTDPHESYRDATQNCCVLICPMGAFHVYRWILGAHGCPFFRSLLESAVKALQSPSELLCGSRPTVRYPCDRQGQLVPLFLRLSNNRIGFGRSSKWVQSFLESMEHELLTTRRQVGKREHPAMSGLPDRSISQSLVRLCCPQSSRRRSLKPLEKLSQTF